MGTSTRGVGFNGSICGWRTGEVISHLPLGQGLFIVLPLVPEIENVADTWDCTFLSVETLKWFLFWFHAFCRVYFCTRDSSYLISLLGACPNPSQYELILSFVFSAAIHQRLESDGTEKVEGSMTQRLENILNSEHLFLSESYPPKKLQVSHFTNEDMTDGI